MILLTTESQFGDMMQRVLGDLHRGQHRTVHIFPEEFDVVLEAFEVLGRRDNLDD